MTITTIAKNSSYQVIMLFVSRAHGRSVDLWKTGHSTCGQNKNRSAHRFRNLNRFTTSPTDSTAVIFFNWNKTNRKPFALWICGQLAKTATCPQAPQSLNFIKPSTSPVGREEDTNATRKSLMKSAEKSSS